MSEPRQPRNRLKALRLQKGWSQAELADRAGISRPSVSAIEINRLVPSVAAALALARALDSSVEAIFAAAGEPASVWAWSARQPCRFWQAAVGGREILFPVESTAAGEIEHDGIYDGKQLRRRGGVSPDKTLVIACCDPAVALLGAEIGRRSGLRVIALPRSSRHALALLAQGLIHVAGVHLSTRASPRGNVSAVRDTVGHGARLLRLARWQEGLALAPAAGVRSIREAVRARLRWIGREPGSGARQCLDELLGKKLSPRRLARDHRGVAEAVRCGWADAGVCLRLVSEEAGLRFLTVQEDIYELCFPAQNEDDPRIRALKEAVQSPSYRQTLQDLPGYDARECGEIQSVI